MPAFGVVGPGRSATAVCRYPVRPKNSKTGISERESVMALQRFSAYRSAGFYLRPDWFANRRAVEAMPVKSAGAERPPYRDGYSTRGCNLDGTTKNRWSWPFSHSFCHDCQLSDRLTLSQVTEKSPNRFLEKQPHEYWYYRRNWKYRANAS